MSWRMMLVAAGALALALAADARGGGGYLERGEPDILAALPAPPAIGGAVDKQDHAIFERTRALAGTPRWRLAQGDSDKSARGLMADFSCAVGVALTPEDAPGLAALFHNATPDIESAVRAAKKRYRRPRPYLRYAGEVCEPRRTDRDPSPDYPSGHAAKGWSIGLILAALAPDRSADILARARAYGESRVVCGVHAASAVTAGQTTARVVVAALATDRAYSADLAAARGELHALRASGPRPKPPVCQAERALTARTPW